MASYKHSELRAIQRRILDEFKPYESLCFHDLCEQVGVFVRSDLYLRVWDDLRTAGRLERVSRGAWPALDEYRLCQ